LLAIGLVIGSASRCRRTRGVSATHGLEPWDASTLVASMAGLALIAAVASWMPARRAAREPTIALRGDGKRRSSCRAGRANARATNAAQGVLVSVLEVVECLPLAIAICIFPAKPSSSPVLSRARR
jgi:hypothetical protein